MNDNDLLAGIQRWVETETKTGDVAQLNRLLRLIEQDCIALGCTSRRIDGRDGHGDHLMIESAGAGDTPGVLILSHIDTVHPAGTLNGRLPFRIEGDFAFGPGIYDMKGGAYLVFAALHNICQGHRTTKLPFRWLIVSDEEVGSPTSRGHILRAGKSAKYVLVSEPARDGGKIVTARKGSARFLIHFHGVAAHSGSRHRDGHSAIKEMAGQILHLENMTDYAQGVTTNCGIVRGGTGINVIPEHAVIELDMRVPNMTLAKRLIAEVQDLRPHDPKIEITVEGGLSRPPFEKSPTTKALFERAKMIASEIGYTLVDTSTGGGSDGNFLADKLPVLDGLGVDGAGAHTLEEHLLISSLMPRQKLMQRLIEELS